MESAGETLSEALEAGQAEASGAAAAADSTDNLYPFVAVAIVGLSVSAVSYQFWSHYTTERKNDLYLMPGILLLLGSGGGLGYLFFSSIYNQCGNTAETFSVMMSLPSVIFGILFLAAAIPGIELCVHPAGT